MRLLIFSLGIAACGCGGSPKAVSAPASAPAATETASADGERHPYAELVAPRSERTAEPNGVWIHFGSPQSTWAKLPSLAKAAPPLLLLKAVAEGGGEILPRDAVSVIDVAKPVDLVLPMGSGGGPTLSFQVRSPDVVLRGAAGLTLRRAAVGVWNIGGVVDEPPESPPALGDDDEGGEEAQPESPGCQLWHLPPPVGFRVMCATSQQSLAQNAEFLASSERLVPRNGDLHLELGGALYRGLRAKFGSDTLHTNPGAQGAEARGQEWGKHFVDTVLEHDALSFDFSLTGEQASVELGLLYGPSSASPWFAKWLEHSSRATLPPTFALLPGSNGLAVGVAGIGDELVKQGFDELWADMQEDMEMSPRVRDEAGAAIAGVIPQGGGFSLASGIDLDAALRVLESDAIRRADAADKPLSHNSGQQLQEALGGWWVVGVDAPAERYLAAVQRFYRATLLKMPDKPGKEAKNRRDSSKLKLVPGVPSGLPKNTLHLVDVVRPDKKYVPPPNGAEPPELPSDTHIFVVPDGEHVWFAISRSEAVAVSHARSLLQGSERLGTRPELGFDPAVPALLLASVELGTANALALNWDSKAERDEARAGLKLLNLAPKHGHLRVPLALDVSPREGAAGWRLRIRSRANLGDLFAEIVALVPPDLPTP